MRVLLLRYFHIGAVFHVSRDLDIFMVDNNILQQLLDILWLFVLDWPLNYNCHRTALYRVWLLISVLICLFLPDFEFPKSLIQRSSVIICMVPC